MVYLPIQVYLPLFAMTMVALVVLFVPRENFGKLFWLGLIWGFLANIFFVLIFSKWFGLFEWRHVYPFRFLNQSVWVSFAWILTIIFFLNHLPEGKIWYRYPVYLLAFSVASAALDKVFYQIGLLHYFHWNPFYRFLVALIWFHGTKMHYHYWIRLKRLREKVGAK
jgi:hypothetical protein